MRHCLLEGPRGLGKTELAKAIAEELSALVYEFPEPVFMTSRVVTDFLLKLAWDEIKAGRYDRQGTPLQSAKPIVLILDEVHRLPTFEVWYDSLSSFHVTVQGRKSWVPYFTLIACTTCPEKLPEPFTSRLLRFRLQRHPVEDLAQIIKHHCPKAPKAIVEASAQRARGVARFAIEYTRSAVNFGGVEYFTAAEIDERGLTSLDREYLEALESYTRPVGVATLAARLQVDATTLIGTVEPFLISLGLIEVTERGRIAAQNGTGVRLT